MALSVISRIQDGPLRSHPQAPGTARKLGPLSGPTRIPEKTSMRNLNSVI
jgi:hypothetical protein